MTPATVPGGGTAGPPRPRLHWGWTMGLTFVLLAGAAAVVLHSPWLQLRDIEVVGAAPGACRHRAGGLHDLAAAG
ncbi:MAG: hypothetical protein H6R33_788 [Actinobacteria bacterium]|nr:hypothetical protein [Actinomycetota bacterium]